MTDDTPDSVDEIRAIRQKIWQKYKTMGAYFEHFNAIPTADALLVQTRAKLKKAAPAKRRRVKSGDTIPVPL